MLYSRVCLKCNCLLVSFVNFCLNPLACNKILHLFCIFGTRLAVYYYKVLWFSLSQNKLEGSAVQSRLKWNIADFADNWDLTLRVLLSEV